MALTKAKNQSIDRLIRSIASITENRCSLLDSDVDLLNDVIALLKKLKRKRNQADAYDLIIKVVELLTKFLLMSEEIIKIIDIVS